MQLPPWYDGLTEDSGSCSITAVMTEKVDLEADFSVQSQIFHSQSSLWAALALGKNAVCRYIRTALDGGR
jgi:vancomycin permeability regulator SanA